MQEYIVKVYNNRTEWYQNNELHRIDGPAIEHKNGDKFWFQNGLRHRIGRPAIENVNGDKLWYQNGIKYFPKL
jgi:hypothetical protein